MIQNKRDGIFFTLIILLSVILILSSYFISINLKSHKFFLGYNKYQSIYEAEKNIFHEKPELIYNLDKIKNVVEGKAGEPLEPLYTPILFYLYKPFALLPFQPGLVFMIIFHFCLYLFAVILVVAIFKRLHKYKYMIIFFSLLYPSFLYVFLNGFNSALWVFLLALSFYLAKKDNLFMAGLALSFIAIKPSFYIIVFIILLFSFRPRLFTGFLIGTIILFVLTGIWDGFRLWSSWFDCAFYLSGQVFYKETMLAIRANSTRVFFYPMDFDHPILSNLEYILVLMGMFALIAPIIYAYRHKINFSRNSFWFIFPLALVLASPYLFNYELIILAIPLIIFLNLMLADRVQKKMIVLIIVGFGLAMGILYFVSMFVYVQLLALLFWFFLINGMMGKRVRHFTPKTYINYWDDY